MKIQLTHLHPYFDKLQKKYGDPALNTIYGAGQTNKPLFAFVFMNPTARNVSAHKSWEGMQAPWLGTKQVWRLFHELGFLSSYIYRDILGKAPADWTPKLARTVYKDIAKHNIYITNLAKATQKDAQKLPNSVFKAYLDLFWQEMEYIKPKIIVTFGTQVSSIIIGKNIKISEYNGRVVEVRHGGTKYKVASIYYPVGQGARNMGLAIDTLKRLKRRIS